MKKEMKTLLLVGSLSAGIFCGQAVYAANQTVPTTISTTPAVKRVIGIKAAEAESVYFTNKMGADVKGIYIKCSDEKDWGKNQEGRGFTSGCNIGRPGGIRNHKSGDIGPRNVRDPEKGLGPIGK